MSAAIYSVIGVTDLLSHYRKANYSSLSISIKTVIVSKMKSKGELLLDNVILSVCEGRRPFRGS